MPPLTSLRCRLSSGLTALALCFATCLAILLGGLLPPAAPAFAETNDRATVTNETSHNLGLFARYKKEAADQPASFYVLAPGHSSDDDYEAVALYLPARVGISWSDHVPVAAAATARLVRIQPGAELTVSDTGGGDGYELNLPEPVIEAGNADVAALPGVSQEELDAEVETAPLD